MQREKAVSKHQFPSFWAMKVKPKIWRCFKVQRPFKITLATLEYPPDLPLSGIVSLWYQEPMKDKLLLCILGPKHPQQVLRLYFFVGDVVYLYTHGEGTVNLLGQAYEGLRSVSNGNDRFSSLDLSDYDSDLDETWYPDEEESNDESDPSSVSASASVEETVSESEDVRQHADRKETLKTTKNGGKRKCASSPSSAGSSQSIEKIKPLQKKTRTNKKTAKRGRTEK